MKPILRIFRTTGTALISFLFLISSASSDMASEYLRMLPLRDSFIVFSHRHIKCINTEKLLWEYNAPLSNIIDVSVIGNDIAVLTDNEILLLNNDGTLGKHVQTEGSYSMIASVPSGYWLYSRERSCAYYFNEGVFTSYATYVQITEPLAFMRMEKNNVAAVYRNKALIFTQNGLIDSVFFPSYSRITGAFVVGDDFYLQADDAILNAGTGKSVSADADLFCIRNDSIFFFTGIAARGKPWE